MTAVFDPGAAAARATDAILADTLHSTHRGVVVDSPPGAGKSTLVVRAALELADAGRPLILTAAYTGLRAGELEALKVGKLNLLRRTVLVDESASTVTGKGSVCGPTKTYAIRSVPLPRPLPDLLAEHIADRADDVHAFVFVSPESRRNRPLHHGNFYRRHFRPAVARAARDDSRRRCRAGARLCTRRPPAQ